MAYTVDMPGAARRHLAAAQTLVKRNHQLVAAYLFGLAAECAIKAIAHTVVELREHEVLHAHLPELRTLVLDRVQGRRGGELRKMMADDSFMTGWAIKVRYAPSAEVQQRRIVSWAEDAASMVQLMSIEL